MKNSTLKNLAIFSSALFIGASALYIYSPTFGSHAAESKEAEVNLTVASTLGIRTSADNLNLEANVGDFVHGAIDVDVTTNSQYGYTLTLEDSDNESSLVHTNTSISDKVTSEFEGAKTSAQMEDNTWGFSLNTTDYYYVPTLGNPARLKSTTGSTAGNYDTTAVDFGAKVGMSLTAGTYTDTVKFTAYVNGADGNPAEDVTASEPGVVPPNYCKNVPYVTGNTLTDPRDGKTYTVMSAKDGHCWMTQNLALIDAELTSENSNLPEGETWTIPASDKSAFTDAKDVNSAYLDSHYGGYYSFYTATAGWGTYDLTSGVSPKDICPKGWRLPTGRFGDFENLRTYYPTAALMASEPELTFGGHVDHNTVWGEGGVGYYWSSTVDINDYTRAYELYTAGNSYVDPINSYYKNYGLSVRCVAK